MDRAPPFRSSSERPYGPAGDALPYAAYPQPYPPPTAQPPLQIPNSDPFHTNRDPFLPASHSRRGSLGLSARAWPPAQGIVHHLTPPQQHPHPFPPPPPLSTTNGIAPMALPYDPSRRRSLGGGSSGSPPLPTQVPHDLQHAPAAPPSFQSRQMPPPSPPHHPSSASSLPGSAPRGPPTASPFAGLRDLASFSSNRPAAGMSISSILGGNEERNPQSSPNFPTNATSTPKSMPPPSPGRARSSSMREAGGRGVRDASPPRHIFGEPRPAATLPNHDRTPSEPRRDGLFGSPQFQSGLRSFQPSPQEQRIGMNGHGAPGRPSSQPIDQGPPRSLDDIVRRDAPYEGRFSTFRHFGEPQAAPRSDITSRHEAAPFQNGEAPTSQPVEREMYTSPQTDRQRSNTGPLNFRAGGFGTPMREDQAGLFRPAYQPAMESPRESFESARMQDLRREMPRSSPPLSDLAAAERARLGLTERPMTFEEHQRMEATQREQQQIRKESDGSVHRALLNLSPELNRKGRNSPLPQAVQGAQTRHIGPGGDNPGIKMEFGRMFSGLGSGVGTATPTAGQSVNGVSTPSRMSPLKHLDGGDLVRTAVAEIEGIRSGSKSSAKGSKRNGRSVRDDEERANGTETPDHQRGSKRAKTNHAAHHHHHHVHPYHHHHHHHDAVDSRPGPFPNLRFMDVPPPQPPVAATPAHHHHHHHTTHAHSGHHHHHVPRVPPARKSTVTVMSKRVLEDCAKKPRTHLGSHLYTSELTTAPPAEISIDAKIKFASHMKPIPAFEGRENCTYTIRVPRTYLAGERTVDGKWNSEHFQAICRHRNLWGTDIYTDDSDVVAAAVHAGWIKGDFGEFNDDLKEVCGNESEEEVAVEDDPSTSLVTRPRRPVKVPQGLDAHITLLILPPLERYASTNQHHVWSREWEMTHDGMSFMVLAVQFVDEGSGNRGVERGAGARKRRLRAEEMKRREAADGLVLFAGGGGAVKVGA